MTGSRVVVITGAAGALGHAYARAFSAAGYAVVVNDAGRTLDGLPVRHDPAEVVAHALCQQGGQAVSNTSDIADPDGAAALVDLALSTYGRLDAVVNNAGFLRDRTLGKMSVEDFDSVVQVHLRGTMLVSQAALPALRESPAGRLVHTASAAIFGSFGQTNYAAAKAGIVGFSGSLALEEAKFGVLSNVVAPFAASRMTQALVNGAPGPLNPELIAPLMVYLGSPECTVSGNTYTAGGGHIARVVMGTTPGWHGPADRPATQAEIGSQLAQINDRAGFVEASQGGDVVIRYLA